MKRDQNRKHPHLSTQLPQCACGIRVEQGIYVWQDRALVVRCYPCHENLRTEGQEDEPVTFALVCGRLYQVIDGKDCHSADPGRVFDKVLVTPKHLMPRSGESKLRFAARARGWYR